MTRKAGEKIIIGGEIAITILPCHGGQVRLGIDAPRAVGIVRAELLQRQGTLGPVGHSAGADPAGVP